jgi:AraC-like DNA-binding protein
LLRTGKCNVTEAAFTIGYYSLSHFSTAFHEAFGCCPGLLCAKDLFSDVDRKIGARMSGGDRGRVSRKACRFLNVNPSDPNE